MFNFKIHGPQYAVLTQNVFYEIEVVELPSGSVPDDLVIEWYRDDIHMPQYPGEDPFKFELYDVGYPAEGHYYALATIGEFSAKSNDIYLEIGTKMRQVEVEIQSRTIVYANIGDTVSFAPHCSTIPPYAHRTCYWVHKGQRLGDDEYIDVKILSKDDFGDYDLVTEAWAEGGWLPTTQNNLLRIVQKDIPNICEPKYIHDLMPGRDAGFIWVGWWVIDEIYEANLDGFKWMDDPLNERFKYKCDLSNLVRGFSLWPDLEIQESRNGYILTKKDLVW